MYLFGWHIPMGMFAEGILHVPVRPVDIHVNEQGPVGTLGQGRVLVPHEVGERGAGDLEQPQPGVAAFVAGHGRGAVDSLHVQRGDGGGLPAGTGEEHLAVAEAAFVLGNLGGRERQFADGQPQVVDLGIGGDEVVTDLLEVAFDGGAVELQRLPDDDVLHRVGRDDHRIVAFGVGRQEVRAEDLHVDFRREEGVVAPEEG